MHQIVLDPGQSGAAASLGLEVENLSKAYDGRPVVDEVSLTVARGETVGLIGANGSGKSTILHSLTGITSFDSGRICIAGRPFDHRDAKAALGFVPDELPLPDSLSGGEYLDFCARFHRSSVRSWAETLCLVFGIDSALRSFIGEYSHGMKKKLQIVAAMAHTPTLLVLDEPFRGLDAEAALTLSALISEHARRGGSVLLATHDLDFADRHCDRVAILSDGVVVRYGIPSALRFEENADSLMEVFLLASGLDRQGATAQSILSSAWPVRLE